jgi:4-amino-4-deoxy-L-arabinose transferase-like glycosyltransferase
MNSIDPATPTDPATSGPLIYRCLLTAPFFWTAFVLLAALRLYSISHLQLVPDEAYYWVWTRHLSLSYFDHPPLCSWLIWLSTSILGQTELAVRLPACILSLASIPVLMVASKAIIPDKRIQYLVGNLMLLSPATVILGLITTPDSPAWFFGCSAIAAAAWAIRDTKPNIKLWLLFGLCLGLAGLSKYTAALIGISVFIAILTTPDRRIHLYRPWFWVAAILSAAVVSPVLIWNLRHDFPSFRFQLSHGFGATEIGTVRGISEYLAGQFALWTPVLFILSCFAIAKAIRHYPALSGPIHILICCFTIPFAMFLYSSSRHRVEVNWPLLVYGPLGIITVLYVTLEPGRRRRSMSVGIAIASIASIALQVPDLIFRLARHYNHANQLFGYRELAQQVDAIRAGRPVFTNRYQDAAELTFYMDGHPEVWSLNRESRANAYDYWPGKPDLSRIDKAVFINFEPYQFPKDFPATHTINVPTILRGRVVRTDVIVIADRISGSAGASSSDKASLP